MGQPGMVAIWRANESPTEHCFLPLAEHCCIGESLALPHLLGASQAGVLWQLTPFLKLNLAQRPYI